MVSLVLVECCLCVQWRDVLLSPRSQREVPAFHWGRAQTLISIVLCMCTHLMEMLAVCPGILFMPQKTKKLNPSV